jgi:hypothetical protein
MASRRQVSLTIIGALVVAMGLVKISRPEAPIEILIDAGADERQRRLGQHRQLAVIQKAAGWIVPEL